MGLYKIISGSSHGQRDTEHFIECLQELPEQWTEFFAGDRELIVTRAPGRIDLMGGIGDYSGSLVLSLPIANATHVAFQKVPNRRIRIVSLPSEPAMPPRIFEISSDKLFVNGSPITYAESRKIFAARLGDHWAAYIVGAFIVLLHGGHLTYDCGANILIRSSVPEGKGVSSSAALEAALMQALISAYQIEISPAKAALLCQKVENLVAGAPCGVMDQMAAFCGKADHLVELLCQPAELKGLVALPEALAVWAIDSGVRHSIRGASYGTVRTAAFMGYRIIADCAGLNVRASSARGHVEIEDHLWNGYLANVTPEEFETSFAARIPEWMLGQSFLDRYQGITDGLTSIDPLIEYPIKRATEHPIYENHRVKQFVAILKNWQSLDQAKQLGELMCQAHQSYSECGLGSDATDRLVELAAAYFGDGIFGAKISGGGNGGTVAILGRRDADELIEEIAASYREETARTAPIISGSSSGTASFGFLTLMPESSATRATEGTR